MLSEVGDGGVGEGEVQRELERGGCFGRGRVGSLGGGDGVCGTGII